MTRLLRRICSRAVVGLLLADFGSPVPSATAQELGAPTEVFVLATLYRRHAAIPAYSHDTLRALIQRIRPAVVVLDVSPRELRDQTVHPSKAEYPQVIFPLVRAHRYRAYAAEPDEPQFTEIVEGLSRWLRAFRTEHPDLAQVDEAYETATLAALTRIWQTPADVNGALSDELLLARRHYQDRVAGPQIAEAWRRWHDHAVTMVRRAARENPGQRILVLLGVDNCARLRPALRGLPELRLVEIEAWLRQPSSP